MTNRPASQNCAIPWHWPCRTSFHSQLMQARWTLCAGTRCNDLLQGTSKENNVGPERFIVLQLGSAHGSRT